jgi:hypothetical protein
LSNSYRDEWVQEHGATDLLADAFVQKASQHLLELLFVRGGRLRILLRLPFALVLLRRTGLGRRRIVVLAMLDWGKMLIVDLHAIPIVDGIAAWRRVVGMAALLLLLRPLLLLLRPLLLLLPASGVSREVTLSQWHVTSCRLDGSMEGWRTLMSSAHSKRGLRGRIKSAVLLGERPLLGLMEGLLRLRSRRNCSSPSPPPTRPITRSAAPTAAALVSGVVAVAGVALHGVGVVGKE